MAVEPKKVLFEDIIQPVVEEDDDSTDADKFAASIVPQTDDPTAPAFTYHSIIYLFKMR